MKCRRTGYICLLVILSAALFCGAQAFALEMPFNGEIAFHKIFLTIPESYIRDSTQSTEDFWIFETGWYSKYIMLSRRDLDTDVDEYLDGYMEYLRSQGAQSGRENFLGLEALRSAQMDGEQSWQELMLVHDGSAYALALRGGTQEEFDRLLEGVAVHDEAPQIAVQEDARTPIDRLMGYLFGS